ncbi:amidohydrolase family protein [Roseivirga sp. BDSF3-8]|uniref:amidohydrolase family protein n=1 Tax=Roseivirga sp. BDSF3-8 TaxID=3241598 RepID=UPI0035322CE1
MNKFILTLGVVLSGLFLFAGGVSAQENFPRNGVFDERPGLYAFTNATIFTEYNKKLENATLLIRDGRIEAVGTNVSVPKGAIVTDLEGKFIYPGLIDMYTSYGLPPVKPSSPSWPRKPQIESSKDGAHYWNEAINADYHASGEFQADEKEMAALRNSGFTTVLTFRPDGISRGTGALVNLRKDNENEVIINEKASAHYSFDKGSSEQDYPSSLMGAIALLRQTYLDAQWYENGGKGGMYDLTLTAFNEQQNLPQIFEADNKLTILRAKKVADEFGKNYIIKGAGDEYQRLNEIKNSGATLIVPVDFPEAMEVADAYDAMVISLEDMKHWELAPSNLAMLAENGVTFAITTDGLKDKKAFMANVRKAIERGLNEEMALQALTATPARLLNAEDQVGSLTNGKVANFIITSGNLFDKETTIYENWVQGDKHVVNDMTLADHRGVYTLNAGGDTHTLEVSGEPGKPKVELVVNDSTTLPVNATFTDSNLVTLVFNTEKDSVGTALRLSGWVSERDGNKVMKGEGQNADGEWLNWTATYDSALEEEEKKEEEQGSEEKEEEALALGDVIYPFIAYGNKEIPQPEDVLFRNATVWTNESQGIIENADVLVRDGKIVSVGTGLDAGRARVIDATGKHLTSGIIDEHSHIAISRGVNEGTQASSAEVRIGDVVDSDDINMYRQLAGGVTAAQLLHGSANPIGGQSALIKFRWGKAPEELKIDGADEYIKFALGENVKQSNWGDFNVVRFPQTRMGTEQVYVDFFTRAREYEQAWKDYNNSRDRRGNYSMEKPRRDLELETLVEILNGERFITCHSYVQSEINMLMKVAERFGFRVNTFTHILEGYKVADKMADHGVGASTFSDWWAYKYEVQEAIPYNAALMNGEGVVTAINSDDAEMARRLNQEAAKSVKYGGMSEEEAWKMVTLNPAKLLHLDDRMGSIKEGKDADLVLWNNNPLSIYAKPEKTMVDGTIYFDMEKDEEKRAELEKERARLIALMMEEGGNGNGKKGAVMRRGSHDWHCEDNWDVFRTRVETIDEEANH